MSVCPRCVGILGPPPSTGNSWGWGGRKEIATPLGGPNYHVQNASLPKNTHTHTHSTPLDTAPAGLASHFGFYDSFIVSLIKAGNGRRAVLLGTGTAWPPRAPVSGFIATGPASVGEHTLGELRPPHPPAGPTPGCEWERDSEVLFPSPVAGPGGRGGGASWPVRPAPLSSLALASWVNRGSLQFFLILSFLC